jgi:predicted TIM-barrel fold metal-dependent hydrolase
MEAKLGYIDTDTHVLECEESWDYLDPSERKYRPVNVEAENPSGGPPRQMYLIGDTFCRKFPTDGRGAGVGFEYSAEISHLHDPALRVKKMDALGVDVQIVISTNFIAAQLEDPYAEAAIMRSWNRWMAERTQGYTDRLRWVMVCPSRTPERAIEEMEICAKQGATGVMLKGIDHGYMLSSPYFYPIYEKAQDLNLTIVVHQGGAREHIEQLGITSNPASAAESMKSTSRTMMGLYSVLASDLNKRFPRLRFAYVESGASWVPFALHHRQRNLMTVDPKSYVNTPDGPTRVIPHLSFAEEMESRRLFVSAEADEDIDYLCRKLGPNCIMIGSDMCHNDSGTDILAHTAVMRRTDVEEDFKRRVVDDNGRLAFDIPKDFRPTDKVTPEQKREVDLVVI